MDKSELLVTPGLLLVVVRAASPSDHENLNFNTVICTKILTKQTKVIHIVLKTKVVLSRLARNIVRFVIKHEDLATTISITLFNLFYGIHIESHYVFGSNNFLFNGELCMRLG